MQLTNERYSIQSNMSGGTEKKQFNRFVLQVGAGRHKKTRVDGCRRGFRKCDFLWF
jgi:hypothetical protein